MARTMRRAAPTLPVTPAMLRHFAAVTVAATAALAMFAQGENSSALEQARKAANAPRGGQTFASANAAPQSVNGMNIAKGTKVDRSGSDAGYDDPDESHFGGEASGDIRNLDSEYRTVALDPLGGVGAAPGAGLGPQQSGATPPQPLQRDSSGIPLPPGQKLRGGPQQTQAKPAPPRRPSREDIDAMMEASRLRSSRKEVEGVNAGGLQD